MSARRGEYILRIPAARTNSRECNARMRAAKFSSADNLCVAKRCASCEILSHGLIRPGIPHNNTEPVRPPGQFFNRRNKGGALLSTQLLQLLDEAHKRSIGVREQVLAE